MVKMEINKPELSLSKLKLIFGSYTKAQEILWLLHDAKIVVRQGFYPHELQKLDKFCRENKIFLVKSKFKVMLADEETGNYSNKGIRLREEDPREGLNFFYFSKDEEKAWLASYYETVGNNRDLGLALGYPECCVNYFCQKFTAHNTDLELKPTNEWTNLTKREKDKVLLSHFPCSSDCFESIKIAQKNFNVLKLVDKHYAHELQQELSSFDG